MFPFIREKCHLRKNNSVIDIELQTEVTNENRIESRMNIPSESQSVKNSSHSVLVIEDLPRHRSYLEIWLNFFYYIGVTPFRIDYERNIRSFPINKLVSLLIKLLAVLYTIFNIRRLAWSLDQKDITQQESASSCIGLVNQFCSLLLHFSLLRLFWYKQADFRSFFKFHDCSGIAAILKPSLDNTLVISVCIFNVFIPLSCSVGGLPILGYLDTWSFSEILLQKEAEFVLSLRKFNDYINNETTQTNSTGFFINDGDIETVIIGSAGMTINFCQLLDIFLSHDCLLLSAVIMWMSTKQIRDQLDLWETRCRRNSCNETERRNLAEKLLKNRKELDILSKQINNIINCFLPVLSMTSMITMSYFMHTCVIRDWYFALYLGLKQCKVCVAILFAMKTSKVAEAYNSWFITDGVQNVLELSGNEFQRQITEMHFYPFGIGNGVFYIDTRFLLNALGLVITYYIMMIVG